VNIINSILITVYSFWRSRHTLWRARKQILPLIWLNFAVLSTWPNLPTGVAAWPLLSFLFVSGVLGLQIRRGRIRWKANTSGYNFYEGTLPEFCSFQVQNPPQKTGQRTCPVLLMEKVSPFRLKSLLLHQSQPLPFIHGIPVSFYVLLRSLVPN
jgi:hypothetical protein